MTLSHAGLPTLLPGQVVVAVDVGGTKVAAARVALRGHTLAVEAKTVVATREVDDLTLLVRELAQNNTLVAASVGVAGPVHGRVVTLTNLRWALDADVLSRKLGCPVAIMNDLVAVGRGVLALEAWGCRDAFATVLPGGNTLPFEGRKGAAAVLALGTGLGVALLPPQGIGVGATEAGHTDFAPDDGDDVALWQYLRSKYRGHVSWERVLSGLDGFCNLAAFLDVTGRYAAPARVLASLTQGESLGPQVTAAAAAGESWALFVVERLVKYLGRFAGNIALTNLATRGVYLAGGVTKHLAGLIKPQTFAEAFVSKGRFASLLSSIPVHVVAHDDVGLIGAAVAATDPY